MNPLSELYIICPANPECTQDIMVDTFVSLKEAIAEAEVASLLLAKLHEDPRMLVGRVMPMRLITSTLSMEVL